MLFPCFSGFLHGLWRLTLTLTTTRNRSSLQGPLSLPPESSSPHQTGSGRPRQCSVHEQPSDFMGLEIWGLFSDKPMIGQIQNVRVPMDPKSENLNLRKLCQNYRLHFAERRWAKPRSKRMIPYLESEHPQILSILCTVGICWGRIKLRPALALLCRSFSPMQSNLRCQARKASGAGVVP